MFDDDRPTKVPQTHQLGAPLDTLSVSELEERIEQLEAEIERLKSALAAKGSSRSAADALFKF